MKNYLLKSTFRSLLFYRKDYINQVLIISLLSAIISGSLLTGDSVRESLKRNSAQKLGNTYILASTGLRFFDSSVSDRLFEHYHIRTVSLLQTYGYCQNFNTGATSLNINVYGIEKGFFEFQGINSVEIPSGTVIINSMMARHLNIKEGDDIIIRLKEADPIPANAPFAPSKEINSSRVMKISKIVGPESAGNFSLGINQAVPQNIFINIHDLQFERDSSVRVNRLLVPYQENLTETSVRNMIKETLIPSDIGLSIRRSNVTGESEIISNRVFIDSSIVSCIISNVKEGYPVITYLANTLKNSGNETPYSFVSGLPLANGEAISDDEIIISRWLAEDLNIKPGGEITMRWYHPVRNLLEEREKNFIVSRIAENEGSYSDPTLMPEFPGISGSTSCSSWDAGIPILMNKIRSKDEDYWDIYKGTPKAFVNYETGKKLWGNIYGPATAVRFPKEVDNNSILTALKGKLDPIDFGFTIINASNSGAEAASQGVDFSSLFLSLGFFIILSCIILLSFAVSIFFESKKEQVRTYYAIGFENGIIMRILFRETTLISLAGASIGIILSLGVNALIIHSLNSVWKGAVQTDTITPDFSLIPVITGFIATILIAQVMIILKLRNFLIRLAVSAEKGIKFHSPRLNFVLLIVLSVLAVSATVISILMKNSSIVISFSGGILIFSSFILAIRQYYIGKNNLHHKGQNELYIFSKRFYSFNPSQAVAPVIFIAAGIFAIIITSSNRQGITGEMLQNNGGTGGYLFWSESAIPIKKNLNSADGRIEFGLNDPEFNSLNILQCLRLSGDDASCLNLNHVKAPPVLGLDPSDFVKRGSFSFASKINYAANKNPWVLLDEKNDNNIIYGIADQTVLKWGLKISVGDTLVFRSETGLPLKIIICAGLKSSVFQGYLIISEENFRNYFPSVSGCSIFLIDGSREDKDQLKNLLNERFVNYGFSVETSADRLASFFVVTNTYLNVFTILGILGLILGVGGLGFMLIRNYNQRSKEFALMIATGFKTSRIKRYILTDQIVILICGILTGTVSALVATFPSLQGGESISYKLVIFMVASVFFTGLVILLISVEKVSRTNLISQLKKD